MFQKRLILALLCAFYETGHSASSEIGAKGCMERSIYQTNLQGPMTAKYQDCVREFAILLENHDLQLVYSENFMKNLLAQKPSLAAIIKETDQHTPGDCEALEPHNEMYEEGINQWLDASGPDSSANSSATQYLIRELQNGPALKAGGAWTKSEVPREVDSPYRNARSREDIRRIMKVIAAKYQKSAIFCRSLRQGKSIKEARGMGASAETIPLNATPVTNSFAERASPSRAAPSVRAPVNPYMNQKKFSSSKGRVDFYSECIADFAKRDIQVKDPVKECRDWIPAH